MKKPSLSTFILVAVVLFGCSVITGATPEGDSKPEATAKAGGGGNEPTAKATLAKATNTTCHELSFFLNPNLASKIKCETVPESGATDSMPFDTYPEYTKVSFTGYPLTNRLMQPVISVFPVKAYADLLPDVINPNVSALEALIDGGGPGQDAIPILPVQNPSQLFLAQYSVLAFQNGTGAGYITQYAQAYAPINNHDLFFSFQGLTSDGAYWVSVIVPISHPSLWETQGDPSNSIWATINENPDAYYSEKATELNEKAPRTFVPMLTLLTDLVQSIVITP